MPVITKILGLKVYLSTSNNCVSKPESATIAKPKETKKYKLSLFSKITSFTNNEDVVQHR